METGVDAGLVLGFVGFGLIRLSRSTRLRVQGDCVAYLEHACQASFCTSSNYARVCMHLFVEWHTIIP